MHTSQDYCSVDGCSVDIVVLVFVRAVLLAVDPRSPNLTLDLPTPYAPAASYGVAPMWRLDRAYRIDQPRVMRKQRRRG